MLKSEYYSGYSINFFKWKNINGTPYIIARLENNRLETDGWTKEEAFENMKRKLKAEVNMYDKGG